jgi:hypothetical protein
VGYSDSSNVNDAGEPVDFVDLNRCFIPLAKDKEPDLDIGTGWGRRLGGWLNWSEVLADRHVVLLAEAQAARRKGFPTKPRSSPAMARRRSSMVPPRRHDRRQPLALLSSTALVSSSTSGTPRSKISAGTRGGKWRRIGSAARRAPMPTEGCGSLALPGGILPPWLADRLREPADARLVVSSIQVVADGPWLGALGAISRASVSGSTS